jgi:hypothetical protein
MSKISTADRYRKFWYDKKISQDSEFKKHLMAIIKKHQEKDFPWTSKELSHLTYENLAEIAIAAVNKKLTITVTSGQDHNDRSDTKCVISQYRNNNKFDSKTGKSNWMHSYSIVGTKNKEGALRVIAYNTILKKFEYFYIPFGCYDNQAKSNKVEIVLESFSVEPGVTPKFTGEQVTKSKWLVHKCESFEEMALSDH